MKTWLLGVGLILFSLCTEIRGECCFDKDVAYTGEQMLERAKAGDQYFLQFFKTYCTEPCKKHNEEAYGVIDDYDDPDYSKENIHRGTCAFKDCDSNMFDTSYCCLMGPLPPWSYFSREYYCNDLNPRVGSYCSKGTCNMFGCDCDGGCIERPAKRRLLSEMGSSSSSNKTTVAKCQEQVTALFNTTFLREKDQILAYYNCLQTVFDGILDKKDGVIQELETTLNGSSRLKAIDTNQDGGIQPSEFDSALDDTLTTQSSGWVTGVPITGLLGMMILW